MVVVVQRIGILWRVAAVKRVEGGRGRIRIRIGGCIVFVFLWGLGLFLFYFWGAMDGFLGVPPPFSF